jgi:uncharacterized protein YcbK (DUF882 family)
MITKEEILKGKKLPEKYKQNFDVLFYKVNVLRDFRNSPMIVTSGFRTIEDHLRIYESKGILKKDIPMQSNHLKCLSIDVLDNDRSHARWIMNNIALCENIGLWFEDFFVTKNWVHIQVVPPLSNKRFFIP